jgi:hypothetical protein
MKKLIVNPQNPNGVLVDMTAEELAQREIDVANATAKNKLNNKLKHKKKLTHLLEIISY